MKSLKKVACVILTCAMLFSAVAVGAADYSTENGAFVFDNASTLDFISNSHSLDITYDNTENAMKLTVNSSAADPDPYALLDLSTVAPTLSADDYSYIALTYRSPLNTSSGASVTELFLSCGSITGPTGGCSVTYPLSKSNAYVTQIIPVANLSYWTGDIHNIRIDCYSAATCGDTMYIDSVIFCKTLADANAVKADRAENTYNAAEKTDGNDYLCTSYQVSKYTSPIWEGNIVYNEAVYPVTDKNGNATYTLMYSPDEVISVYNATFNASYTEGVDFTISGNTITFLKTGKIPTKDYYYIHPQSNPNNYDWSRYYKRTSAGDGKWEYWGQSNEFFAGYMNITYTHSDTWTGYVPENKADTLPNTSAALTNNDDYNIVFFGDSINGGANSSSYRNVYPYAEYWNEQIISELSKDYGATNINATYSSVGGSTASDMVSSLNSSVISHAPDLVFIEFGMNDAMNESQSSSGSASRLKSDYKSAVKQMIDGVRASYPNCEFVLVAPFYGNIYCHYQSYFDACRDALNELEAQYSGVAVADVTSMHSYLLTFKDYLDCSGDNMCHPNDFMSRIYAQICLETIVPGGINAYVPQNNDGETDMNRTAASPSGHGWLWTNAEAYGLFQNYGSNTQNIELTVDLCLLPNSGESSSAKLWTSDGSGLTVTPNYVTVGGVSTPYTWGAPDWGNWHTVTFKIQGGAASIAIDGEIIASVTSGVIAYTSYQMLFSQTGSMAIDNISLKSGGGTVYFSNDFENQTEAENLCSGGLGAYARLSADTVTFDANKGAGAPANQIKVTGTSLKLTAEVPVRDGYEFAGWATSADAAEAQFEAGGTYTADSSATLYAVWQEPVSDIPPVISSVTASGSVTDTGNAEYTVSATGGNALSYSWELVSVANDAITLSGADTAILTVSVSEQQTEGFTAEFRCTVTDTANSLTAVSETVTFTYTTTYTSYTVGDLNEDGVVTPKDSNLMLRLVVSSMTAEKDSNLFMAADINCDGTISGKDSNLLLSYLTGNIPSLK